MAGSSTQAVRTADFINSIGINTHIDFTWTAYGNLQRVIDSLNYIGVKNVRDSANNPADIGPNGWWQQVANATGVKFDAFIGSGSPAVMQTGLQYIQQLAPQGILNYIEGGNEEDNAYAASQGNTMAITAEFQQQVYNVGKSLGLPVINMSFGAGWDTPNGNYDAVGDISPYSNYANGHIYFGTGQSPSYNINWVKDLAQMSSKNPVIATEMGWYTTGVKTDANSVSETVQAKYMLDGLLDAYKAGYVKTYLYELLDQKTGDGYSENNFGLFHSDGTPKLAAVALHNLTTLLADTGNAAASFTPGALTYTLTGMQSTDNSLLMQKSDGTYWLSIWNETRLSSATSSTDIVVPNHTITLTLESQASGIILFDPLLGTTALQSLSNAQTIQISLPDHPIIVEIIPSLTSPTPTTPTPIIPPSTSAPSSSDLSVTAPTSASLTVNGTAAVTGISIVDAWAASNPGTMALNLTVTGGTITMLDASGKAVAGSGTNAIHVNGTLAQLNAELATLKYQAANTAGTQTLVVDVWNQAGVEVMKSTALNVAYGSNNLAVMTPASVMQTIAGTSQVIGVSIFDPWAASNPGTMALNLSVTNGTITMLDASTGRPVAGSGTNAIHVTGTLAELNAELATLSYKSPGSVATGTLSVNAWNQAGISTTQTIAVKTLLPGNVQGTTGNDILSSTPGKTLTGGSGADIFYFTMNSTSTGAGAEHIADFNQAAGDKINLHGYGLTAANFNSTGALTGAKSFTFSKLMDATNHPYTKIMMDTNGDHISDHEIRLDNAHVTLQASDFAFA